jgi:hypothetical protein
MSDEERLNGFQNLVLGIGSSNAPSEPDLPPTKRTELAWRASTEWICSAAETTDVPARFPICPVKAATPTSSIVDESIANVSKLENTSGVCRRW